MTEEVAALMKVLFCLTIQTPRQQDEIAFLSAFGAVVDEIPGTIDALGSHTRIICHLANVHIILQRISPYAADLAALGIPSVEPGMRHFFYAVHDRDRIIAAVEQAGVRPIQTKIVDPMQKYGDWAKVAFWRSTNGLILGTEEIFNGPPPTRPQPKRLVERVLHAGVKTPDPMVEAQFLETFGARIIENGSDDPLTLELRDFQIRLYERLPYENELERLGIHAPFGMNHANFLVNDVDAVARAVTADGVTVLRAPYDLAGGRAAYFRSANGTILGIQQS